MTDTTGAAELREAAALLREAASHATPGPWRTHDTWLDSGGHTATVLTDRPDIKDTDLVAWLPTMSNAPWDETRNAWRNAGWMALMDPSVGLALADWLERAAVNAAVLTWPNDVVEGALAVARQVLSTTTGQQCPECGDTGACNGGPCPLGTG
ncbi:ead/Ea22-like family protein [[Kitasatospora] papulosa]|uniref:ead/Ea22-like family protein n=1 Tax=[Kitasatospora] papulosa TaxID=1464011 RepID=UPI003857CC74